MSNSKGRNFRMLGKCGHFLKSFIYVLLFICWPSTATCQSKGKAPSYIPTLWPSYSIIKRMTNIYSQWNCVSNPGQTRKHCCKNIMFPINISLFAHLRKHCCGNKICFSGSKNVSQLIQKHFCCGNNVCPRFQMFPARETLFSRSGMLKQCF